MPKLPISIRRSIALSRFGMVTVKRAWLRSFNFSTVELMGQHKGAMKLAVPPLDAHAPYTLHGVASCLSRSDIFIHLRHGEAGALAAQGEAEVGRPEVFGRGDRMERRRRIATRGNALTTAMRTLLKNSIFALNFSAGGRAHRARPVLFTPGESWFNSMVQEVSTHVTV